MLLRELIQTSEKQAFDQAQGDVRTRRPGDGGGGGGGGLGGALFAVGAAALASTAATSSRPTSEDPDPFVPPPPPDPSTGSRGLRLRGPSSRPTASPGGEGSDLPVPTREDVATGVLGASALAGIGKLLPSLGGSGTSGGLPAALPAILAGKQFQRGQRNGDKKTLLERLFGTDFSGGTTGPGGVQAASLLPLGAATSGGGTENRAGSNSRGGDVTVNVDVTAEGVSRNELKSAINKAQDEVLREFERQITGGGGRGPKVR